MLWSIISWIIVGGIAGWIASMIMKSNAKMGIGANILAGVIGAFLVGFVVSWFTDGGAMPDAWSLSGFIASIVGACLVIWIANMVKSKR